MFDNKKFGNIKFSANRNNLLFDITIDYLNSLVHKNCPWCDCELNFNNKILRWNSPSVDRIHNDYGYVKNNIIVVCFKCNRDKGNHNKDWFKNILKSIEDADMVK